MRVGDRVEHVEEEAKPRLDAETAAVAVAIYRLALDVLEDEIRLSGRRHSGVEEARDVGIGKARENAPLAPEAFLAGAADEARVQELDGGVALELAVAAASQPYVAHSALADEGDQRVGADRLAGE